jgi:tRNA dimethylallyltransferase
MELPPVLADLPPDRPVLLAGPTGSGKSALALALAEARGGVIINADALQVYRGWRILTARPTAEDEARAPHALYGHVPLDVTYSVGAWLRDVAPLIAGSARPIVTGGTGLYFSALTTGLAEIPAVPAEIRARSNALSLEELLAGLDLRTRTRIDTRNRARVQRAWEVLVATGRQLSDWQESTPAPLMPVSDSAAIVLSPDVAWLEGRIEARFDAMLAAGAVEEARANLAFWNPKNTSSRAIGAAELVAHLQGRLTLAEARAAAILASRQYAKRQRTWMRNRLAGWTRLALPPTG